MRRYTYIIVLGVLAGLSACKKTFLDVEDNSVVLAEQYVVDLNTTQHYLNGVYAVLGKDFYQGYNQIYPDLIADNIKPAAGKTTFIDQYNWSQTDLSGSNMNTMWLYGYQLARSCSFVIDKASQYGSQDPEKSQQMQAEAYAVRALVHFIMVNVFAQSYNYSSSGQHSGIPYVTSFDWTNPAVRNSVGEVYDAITEDLNKAIGLFQASGRINPLTMNTWAVKALLARCYLYKEDWQQAKALAIEVLNAVPLMTGTAYPSKLFTPEESEALFQLAPSSINVLAGGYSTNFQGRYFNNGSASLFLATTDIANLLRQNVKDVRKNWIKSGGAGKDSIVKYPINLIAGFSPTSGSYYQTLLRSSEMYLTAAEATARLADENSSRTYLDAIRKRADPTIPAITASGAALMDSICLERRKELAFEGVRMFDLQRWKKDVQRNDALTSAVKLLPYPNDKAIAPIPLIDSQNGIEQNPGY